MATFQPALTKVLENEGGYVNNPNDRGGETYRGIARNFWPTWEGWEKVDEYKPNIPDKLLLPAVEKFYKLNFWDKIKGDEIKDQEIAESIFDFAVNAGIVTASKCAQKAVCCESYGVIGKQTLTVLNCTISELFILRFTIEKINHYIKICEKSPLQKTFFFGWVRRAVC